MVKIYIMLGERNLNMDNDKILLSMSKYIAYWYTLIKGEKDIVFPIDKINQIEANKIFKNRYNKADVIISENGHIYKISKEICCESNNWSYIYYLDRMEKNYHIKKKCQEILPYNLTCHNNDKLKKICTLKIPSKIITINYNHCNLTSIKKIIDPYLKCLTYIDTKDKKVIAYPDIVAFEKHHTIKIFLNCYHHHNMEKQITEIKKQLNKKNINMVVKSID